jgi:hypothetical protein
MDVLVLSSPQGSPGRGVPERGIADGLPVANHDAARRKSWRAALRLLGHGSSAPGPETGAVAARRNPLLAYTAASITLGLGMLMASTVIVDLQPAIDPGLPGPTLAGPTGGLLLWLLFGLLGSVRVLRTPDGGHITFHMPFIGAAMILGGPTAGAWVAFLSTIERRELESQAWYGILANHAVLAIAAVLGGVVTRVVAMVLGSAAGEVAAGPWGAATIVAAGAGGRGGAGDRLDSDGRPHGPPAGRPDPPCLPRCPPGHDGPGDPAGDRARPRAGARLRPGRLVGTGPDRRVRAPDLGQRPDACT